MIEDRGHAVVTPLDRSDPRCGMALEAEARLFQSFGLECETLWVELPSNGARIRVTVGGTGDPVVIVPGGSGEAFGYIPLLAGLRNRRWIAINRPGGGLSDGVDHRRLDLRHLAVEVVDAVLDAVGVGRATVVSNSMGGLWGMWYAAARPARVERLVEIGCPALLLGTSAPFFMRLVSLPGLGAMATRLMQPRSTEEARRGLGRTMRVPESAVLSEALLAASVAMSALPTFRLTWRTLIQAVLTPRGPRRRYATGAAELARVAAPVLFVWGARDPFGDPSVGVAACRLLRSGRLEIVGEGHLPHLEEPDACAKAIGDFMLATPAAGELGEPAAGISAG